MADYRSTITKRDQRLLARLGRPVRWTKKSGATVDGNGVLDLAVEFFSDHDTAPYLGKVLQVSRTFIDDFTPGDTLTDLDSGKVYSLHRVLKDDGYVRHIEVTA